MHFYLSIQIAEQEQLTTKVIITYGYKQRDRENFIDYMIITSCAKYN